MAIPFTKRGSPRTIYYRRFATFGQRLYLDVSIKEADGSVRSFLVPYLPCPICCNLVFQISILSPDASDIWCKESGGLSRGKLYIWLNNLLTLYGGTILSDNYNAILWEMVGIHRWEQSLLMLPDR